MWGPEDENLSALLYHWRTDALAFLRQALPRILLIVVVVFLLLQALRLLTRRLERMSESVALPTGLRRQQLKTLSSVLYSVGAAVIIFLALLEILPLLNINIGPLLASAGIAGLAIGFGAQTLVRDVINGFFILVEDQYDVGDTIRVASIQGTVEKMTLRSTLVRDDHGGLATIPNGEIKIVSNLTRDWVQAQVRVSVAYDENSDRVIRLLQEVGLELRNDPQYGAAFVADPQVPGIERVAGNNVEYAIIVKVKPGTQHAVLHELRRRIRECFKKQNIKPGSAGEAYVVENGH